jgi:pyruvate dehydrogenase E1 component beta subunit
MAQLTYREAVAAGMAQEMRRDDSVVFLGEDVAAAGGVFKATVGLFEEFGPTRVRDTPISEQAILGAAMGAAMTGLKPIAEVMFSDFFAVCWDIVVNQIAKTHYMTDGQINLPLVIRSGNGAGSRFGAQHSQAVENWAMAIPGLKVVAPAMASDVKGLLAASIRDPNPVSIRPPRARASDCRHRRTSYAHCSSTARVLPTPPISRRAVLQYRHCPSRQNPCHRNSQPPLQRAL